MLVLLTPPGPTVEQQTEMARHAGRTLASLLPEQVKGEKIILIRCTGSQN